MQNLFSKTLLFSCALFVTQPIYAQNNQKMNYPTTRKDPTVSDNYHGKIINDPYRWLEDDNSEETKAWVKAQNALTFGYLEQISSRKTIKDRLEKSWNYEKYGTPFKEGGKYYFFKNSGLQNQAVMYQQATLESEAKAILDPNTLSKEGTVALGAISFNEKGNLMAYQVAKAGSDWQTIAIRNMETGEDLAERLEWVKFSGISWNGNDGFFYSRYATPQKGAELTAKAEFQKAYYHKIGTSQSEDILVYDNKEKASNMHSVSVSEDGKFQFLTISESTSGNQLFFRANNQFDSKGWLPIAKNFDNDWDVIDNIGEVLLLKTNLTAPRYHILAIDTKTYDKVDTWKELVAENETDVLQNAQILNEKLLVSYLHDASSKVKIFDPKNGKFLKDVELVGIGTVGAFSGKKKEKKAFYAFSSFTRPTTIYELDLDTYASTLFKAPKVPDYNADDYETKQVFFTSKDGTRIPMFISYKKGIKLDGSNPTLLYGYGGFNISVTPAFSPARAVLMNYGAIYAVANIRGGGEYGEDWHKMGTKDRKQNVFDDFIAAAEYLQKEKYTSAKRLAIQGGSNGGLLVGACMAQRPDLFRVAFPAVGVLDMLRYQQFTIGRAWSVDYGLSENKDEFGYLIQYSPLHNLKNVAYPSTMITTGDHDDRVVPAHSFKFAAELQANQQGTHPTLIRIETSAGHGAGKPTGKVIEEAADIMTFMFSEMGVKI